MNIDCQWIEKNMEAFCCDRLASEEHGQARRHIASCALCRQKVDEINAIDPLIKQFFQHELRIARTPLQRRWSIVVGATAAAVAAVVLVIVLRAPHATIAPPVMNPVAPETIASAGPQTPTVPKSAVSAAAAQEDRAKPLPVAPDRATSTANVAAPPSATDVLPDFLVTDPAGYSRSLKDYRGYVLIVGVWNGKQPRTIANLERVYQTFGPNTKLRILGVANKRQPKPAAATFPIAYNQGSTLLGAKESEFLVVDGEGIIRSQGTLLQDGNALIASIRSTLTKINP